MVDVAQLAIRVDSSDVEASAVSLNKMGTAAGKASKQANVVSGGFQGLGRKAGAASIQVQQLVGQVQGGVNPMVALSMQAADLGIVLGAPLLGAIAGITAGLAGPFIMSLMGASDELDDFNKKIEETISSLRSSRIEISSGAITTLKDRIKESREEIERLGTSEASWSRSSAGRSRNRAKNELEIIELRKQQQKDIEALAVLEEDLKEIREESFEGMMGPSAEDFYGAQVDALRKSQQEQIKAQSEYLTAQNRLSQMMSRDFMAALSPDQQAAQMLGQTMQQYQQMLDDRLISDEQYLAAKEAAETRYYERIKDLREQDKQLQLGLNEATLNGASQLFGNLAEIAKAGGEDSFEAWKRMAQAQALVNVALGVSNALATVPAPLNFAVAGTVAAMGAVQVAQIEQQQYQAREYGGQVKAGSSYLVGERGPEMITMGGNGNVTPTKDVNTGSNTTVVLQVSTGVQSTVRAEMASMMPMIAKTVQRVVGAQRR